MKTLRSERTRKLETARQLLGYDDNADQSPPGHGPDYIKHLRAIIRQATKYGVVLYARISDPKPGKRETCSDQLLYLREAIADLEKEFGVTIPIHEPPFYETVSSWRWKKSERVALAKAVKLAAKHNAVLVGPDVSRFVRNKDCKNGVEPTVEDYEKLMRFVGKVRLATIADPAVHEDRSRSVKRGHKAKDAKPGRPAKKTKRPKEEMKKEVERLLGEGLKSYTIAKMLRIPYKTVLNWRPK